MYPYNYNNQLIRVNGIDGAKMYQMNPNSAVALFDSNEDIFYVKQTDGAGFGSIRTFKFEEVLPTSVSGTSEEYMTRKEMEEYVEHIISERFKSNGRKSKANDEHTDD